MMDNMRFYHIKTQPIPSQLLSRYRLTGLNKLYYGLI